MADAKLIIMPLEQPNEATLEFSDKDYTIRFTQIDFLKAMNIYGEMESIANTNEDNWAENAKAAVDKYDEALRIVDSMIGKSKRNEIIKAAGVRLDVEIVASILGTCIAAISMKIDSAKKAVINAEVAKLSDV